MWLDAGLDVAPEELLGPVPPTVGRGRRNELAMSTARNRQANGIPTLRQHNEVNGLNPLPKKLVEQMAQLPSFGGRSPFEDRFAVTFRYRTSKPFSKMLAAVGHFHGSKNRRRNFGAGAIGAPIGTGIQHSLTMSAVRPSQ